MILLILKFWCIKKFVVRLNINKQGSAHGVKAGDRENRLVGKIIALIMPLQYIVNEYKKQNSS